MAEQIICNIVRPEVGVGYIAESPEWEKADKLAAAEISFTTLAKFIRQTREELGLPCPSLVSLVADSDLWRNGM